MRKILLTAAFIAAMSLPTAASAHERLLDGALGAVAGAVVAGPVGLIAGGVVGLTAGPSIASSWGLRGHRHYRRARYVRHEPQY
jgi:sugar phosphate permease